MNNQASTSPQHSFSLRMLTYLMFFSFAMTTDAVGKIIPVIIEEFSLSLTQAGAFHYATMIAIAVSGIGLGFLADRFGRKRVIIGGLALYGLASVLFIAKLGFLYFLFLLVLSGLAIGIFRTGALALIGDISQSSQEHTRTMNFAEAWFAVGAIAGPALATWLISSDVSWTYLYVIAGGLAALLCVIAGKASYPAMKAEKQEKTDLTLTFKILKDPYALGFSLGAALYVVTEAGIYVWMPTLLNDYEGDYVSLVIHALTIFFVFRAIGRFAGAWILSFVNWRVMLLVTTGALFLCFLGAEIFGVSFALFLLPSTGLFMSVIYPTINSKGISCFPAHQHGSVAGIILFFTAAAAALGPLAMAVIGDLFGNVRYGFTFACVCSGALFAGALWIFIANPVEKRLSQYHQD